MQSVNIDLPERGYTVFIGSGLLGKPHEALSVPENSSALIVSNETVAPLYLASLSASLAGARVDSLILPDGESFKTMASWSKIIDKLIDMRASRDATLFTLGGGVIGDMGGFAAATYMRGINFVQIPTSLLSQVDASVGGKTGFNHPSGKNLVGAFHQPGAVVIDIDTLDTLPEREFSAGLSEVVKIAAVRDEDFLCWLEENSQAIMAREAGVLTTLIRRSVENKASVVVEDEREAGVRALLNFGHSFAHAIETLTDYRMYLHGEAVSIGMMIATRLSEIRGMARPGLSDRLGRLLSAYDLPLEVPEQVATDAILDTLKLDKKVMAGSIRLILIESAGHGFIDSNSGKIQISAAINASRA